MVEGMEIVFNGTQEGDGGFVAGCLSHDIFTEGDPPGTVASQRA